MKNLYGLRNYPMKIIRTMSSAFFVYAFVSSCLLLCFAVPASALNLTVNDFVSDLGDDDGANGICLTSGGTCTLRAAMQEINGTFGGANNTIAFSLSLAPILSFSPMTCLHVRNVTLIGPGSDSDNRRTRGILYFQCSESATSLFVGYSHSEKRGTADMRFCINWRNVDCFKSGL
jgi:hypothetical protein